MHMQSKIKNNNAHYYNEYKQLQLSKCPKSVSDQQKHNLMEFGSQLKGKQFKIVSCNVMAY